MGCVVCKDEKLGWNDDHDENDGILRVEKDRIEAFPVEDKAVLAGGIASETTKNDPGPDQREKVECDTEGGSVENGVKHKASAGKLKFAPDEMTKVATDNFSFPDTGETLSMDGSVDLWERRRTPDEVPSPRESRQVSPRVIETVHAAAESPKLLQDNDDRVKKEQSMGKEESVSRKDSTDSNHLAKMVNGKLSPGILRSKRDKKGLAKYSQIKSTLATKLDPEEAEAEAEAYEDFEKSEDDVSVADSATQGKPYRFKARITEMVIHERNLANGDTNSDGGDNSDVASNASDDSFTSCVSGQSGASFRTGKKRVRRKVPLTATMGYMPSQALQLIVDNPGKNILDFYDIKDGKESKLGEGSFGSVRVGRVKATGALRAVKFVQKEQMKTRIGILKKEIEITKQVDHPNLIKLYETFEDDDTVFLVVELCRGGNLFDRLDKSGGFTEKESAIAMQQVLRGVFYMHKNGLVHRDLKPENCLLRTKEHLEKTTLKVTDFGLSVNFKEGQVFTTRIGTATYMAPEVIHRSYNESCDMWSAGVMTYFLLSSRLPFYGRTEEAVYERIVRGTLKFKPERWKHVSQDGVDFVQQLVVKDVNKRLGVKHALAHSWFGKQLPERKDLELRQDMLNNLRTYRSLNKLKRAALSVVASMLLEADINSSREIFLSLDKDGDGSLSVVELRDRILRASTTEKHLRKTDIENLLFKVYAGDTNLAESDAGLQDFTYTEFLAATFDRTKCMVDAILKAAFASFDKNGDGNISMAELAGGRLLGHLSLEELSQLFEDLDTNGDCYIDYDEFQAMMLQGDHPPGSPKSPKGKDPKANAFKIPPKSSSVESGEVAEKRPKESKGVQKASGVLEAAESSELAKDPKGNPKGERSAERSHKDAKGSPKGDLNEVANDKKPNPKAKVKALAKKKLSA